MASQETKAIEVANKALKTTHQLALLVQELKRQVDDLKSKINEHTPCSSGERNLKKYESKSDQMDDTTIMDRRAMAHRKYGNGTFMMPSTDLKLEDVVEEV